MPYEQFGKEFASSLRINEDKINKKAE